MPPPDPPLILPFRDIDLGSLAQVGGAEPPR